MAGRSRLAGASRLCAVLAASLLALLAAPVAAQTASFTTTPPNGTHYVAGDAITTHITFSPGLESGNEVHVEFHWPTTPTRGWRGIILNGQP